MTTCEMTTGRSSFQNLRLNCTVNRRMKMTEFLGSVGEQGEQSGDKVGGAEPNERAAWGVQALRVLTVLVHCSGTSARQEEARTQGLRDLGALASWAETCGGGSSDRARSCVVGVKRRSIVQLLAPLWHDPEVMMKRDTWFWTRADSLQVSCRQCRAHITGFRCGCAGKTMRRIRSVGDQAGRFRSALVRTTERRRRSWRTWCVP